MGLVVKVRLDWIRECEQHRERRDRNGRVWGREVGMGIEMSRWVAPNFVVPERDGTAYILIQRCVPGSSVHLWPRAQWPLRALLGLMRTGHKSLNLIRGQNHGKEEQIG
jgi:hypothetical protein